VLNPDVADEPCILLVRSPRVIPCYRRRNSASARVISLKPESPPSTLIPIYGSLMLYFTRCRRRYFQR